MDCDPQKKPPAVGACSIQDCPPEGDPFGADWSGSGWPSNEVLNEIDSVPEARPPPRLGSTTDFHYHNRIEDIDRAPESSVQVDDFYYDYNFINFHEDLSDDFESDGNGAGGEPTQTAPAVTAETLETEETEHADLEPSEDGGNAGAESSEDLDDFLSEDYLLPVSTPRSPPVGRSQAEEEGSNRVGEPAADEEGPEVGHGSNVPADIVNPSATSPGYQTMTPAVPTTPTRAPVGGDGVYVQRYHKENTLIPEHREWFPSVQLEESASGTPQTPSQGWVSPSGFRLEGLDPDHSHFRTDSTGGYSRDTDFHPTSVSGDSTPTPLPLLQTSGSQQASVSSTPSGTRSDPPPDLEGATHTPPAGLLPAAGTHDPTEPPSTQTGGAESSPQAPWADAAAPDETLTPITAWSRGGELPPDTTPEQITTPTPHPDPPASTAVLWPLLLPASVQTTVSAQVAFPGYWITGNWSAVSPSVTRNHRSHNSFIFSQKKHLLTKITITVNPPEP